MITKPGAEKNRNVKNSCGKRMVNNAKTLVAYFQISLSDFTSYTLSKLVQVHPYDIYKGLKGL